MMSEHRDWERTLKETSFDLPESAWLRLENDMRGWLAREAREDVGATKVPRGAWERFLQGWRGWGMGLAGACAACAIGFGAWIWTSVPRGDQRISWAVGQALDERGHSDWNWAAEHCRIQGNDARLMLSERSDSTVEIRIQRGEATFHVQHRRPGESFAVDVGDCKVHVVGTVFTVGVDSLRPWVAVQEGRILLDHPRFHRFVGAGQTSTCTEDGPAGASTAVHVEPPSGKPDALSVAEPVPTAGSVVRPSPIRAVDSVAVPTCQDGPDCVRSLSEFVYKHPNHPAAPGVALRWARLAARGGDDRDALVAYGFASASPALADLVRLESLRLRARGLSQEKAVADSLDGWIPRISSGSATWRAAWTLREEVARRLGDAGSISRARKALAEPITAESGP
jgi:hypothetical protein